MNEQGKSSEIRELIITNTIKLIKESDGLIGNITIRKIAENSNVAVGLINYHFKSKNKLIEICIERIISKVMKDFPNLDDSKVYHTVNSDITSFTINVFKFLVNNPEIAKISMLSDFTSPHINSNSSVSYRAIYKGLDSEKDTYRRKVKAFIFLATIQLAFLNRNITKDLLSTNLTKESDYQTFFKTVNSILNI